MRKIKVTSVVVGMVAALAVAPAAIFADDRPGQQPGQTIQQDQSQQDQTPQQGQMGQVGQQGQIGQQGQTPVREITTDRLDSKPLCCKRAEKVIGAKVENASGESLGHIKDLAIDPTSGRVVYGVLNFGGFLGMGEKLFAIPWGSLSRSADGDFVLNVSEDRLKNAEGFAADNWPTMADPQWAQATHDYYGQKPYWHDQRGIQPGTSSSSSTMASGTSTGHTTTGDGAQLGEKTPAGPYAQRQPGIDPSAPQTSGPQAGVRQVEPSESDDDLAAGQELDRDREARERDRQVAMGETGRSEFKSSVGMTDRSQQGIRSTVLVKGSDLLGEAVDNHEREALGAVKDLIIDSNNGRINSLVLARGGVLGLGEELYAIPWQKVTVQVRADKDGRPSNVDDVIVNVDKEMLQNAPSFTADNWPQEDEPSHFVTVYRYYAVPQYWQ